MLARMLFPSLGPSGSCGREPPLTLLQLRVVIARIALLAMLLADLDRANYPSGQLAAVERHGLQ